MEQAKYTSKEIKEANAFLQILDGVPQNKRFILALVADAFINGMNAQEQLTAVKAWKRVNRLSDVARNCPMKRL